MKVSAKHSVFYFLVLILSACASVPDGPITDLKPTVVLVSIDGFRWDYPARKKSPRLDEIGKVGVKAKSLIPVFPTLTFPNHYSLVTGTFPEAHGIIDNEMYDPETKESFSLKNKNATDASAWWGGEPLWVTVEKTGGKSATMFWPGSNAEIGGIRPSYWKAYDSGLPREARVAQVLDWLKLPVEKRPTFITLYFDDTDVAGHRYGPDSAEEDLAIANADQALGLLIDGFKRLGIEDKVHLIVVSDHGMAAVQPEKMVVLDKLLAGLNYKTSGRGAVLHIWPEEKDRGPYLKNLKKLKFATVYEKEKIPERFHFRKHRRIAPLVVVANQGAFVVPTTESVDRLPKGMHGYDPNYQQMHAIFFARGPEFATGKTVNSFSLLEVASVIKKVLGLPADKTPAVFKK